MGVFYNRYFQFANIPEKVPDFSKCLARLLVKVFAGSAVETSAYLCAPHDLRADWLAGSG